MLGGHEPSQNTHVITSQPDPNFVSIRHTGAEKLIALIKMMVLALPSLTNVSMLLLLLVYVRPHPPISDIRV